MWDGRRNIRTGLLLSDNTSSSPFNSLHGPDSCSPSALLHNTPPPLHRGIELILLSRGRGLQCTTFLQRLTGKVAGRRPPWQEPSSDTSSHGHPLQSNHPRLLLGTAQRGFFNELKILSSEGSGVELTCRDVYPCMYMKHGYTVKSHSRHSQACLDSGFF